MTATIIPFPERAIVRRPVEYSDVVIEHARKIELMFAAMEDAMRGDCRPSDTEDK